MREMKNSGIDWIGDIPYEWKVSKNKYLLDELYSGGTPTATNPNLYCDSDDNNGISFCSISDMSTVDYVEKTKKHITELGRDEKKLRILDEDTVLYSIYATVGEVSQLKIKSTISQAILALMIKANVEKKYYMYCLKAMKDYVFIDANGNTQFNLNAEKVNNFYFPIPSLAEQTRIANFLDKKVAAIDNVIAKTKESIEEYKKLMQSIITQAVTNGVRGERTMKDSGMNYNVMIPENWNAIISRFVIDSISDVDHAMPEAVETGYPYLMIGDLKPLTSEIDFNKAKKISEEDYKKLIQKTRTLKCDVIFARYATIGIVTYVDVDDEFVVSYACVTVHPKQSVLLGKYLFYYFKSETFFNDVQQYINSNTQGNIGIEALFKTKIVVPTIEEQKEIVEYLDSQCENFDSLIQSKEKVIEELNQYKKSLIYEYVTGKKEVPNE